MIFVTNEELLENLFEDIDIKRKLAEQHKCDPITDAEEEQWKK